MLTQYVSRVEKKYTVFDFVLKYLIYRIKYLALALVKQYLSKHNTA